MLVQVRSALRRGDLVLALIDLQCAQANRSMTFHTKFGEIHLADALLRVAVACSAPTLFMMSETDRSGTVVLTISSPVSGAHARADALLRDFADAVAGHVARL